MALFPVLLWPALVAVVAAASLGNNRYRLCAEPSLIWLASFALCLLMDRLRMNHRVTVSNVTESTAINPS